MQTLETGARVKANLKKDPPIPNNLSADFTIQIPESVAEAVETFGEAVVLDTFNDQYIVKAQARVRDLLIRGQEQASIQAYIDKWKLGERAESTIDVLAYLREQTKDMTPEQQIEYLKNKMRQAGQNIE